MLKNLRNSLNRYAVQDSAAYALIGGMVLAISVICTFGFSSAGIVVPAVISGVIAVASMAEAIYINVNAEKLRKKHRQTS